MFHDCKNFTELLERRRKDFPQAVVAGWMLPSGQLVSAAATAADKTPTVGEMAAAWAACTIACFKRIDELCADNPELRESILNIVLRRDLKRTREASSAPPAPSSQPASAASNS